MKLIDTDAVRLPEGFFEKVDNVPKFYDWLNSLPTIDAVPVVRCKDCKWWKSSWKYCHYIHFDTDKKFYCADGERRTDG